MAEEKIAFFKSLGFDDRKAKDTAKNDAYCSRITAIAGLAGAAQGCDKKMGTAIYHLATKLPADAPEAHLQHAAALLAAAVSTKQLDGALAYLAALDGAPVDDAALKESAGVGM